MKLKLFAISTGFAVALGGCTLNPIGEDPGINRDSDDSPSLAEGDSNGGGFAPGQGMSAPETVDPATGTPIPPPAAGPVAGQPDPGAQTPEPIVIDEPEGNMPGDMAEPEPASEEPILPPEASTDASIDGGVPPFNDAGDAGHAEDAAVPSFAR